MPNTRGIKKVPVKYKNFTLSCYTSIKQPTCIFHIFKRGNRFNFCSQCSLRLAKNKYFMTWPLY